MSTKAKNERRSSGDNNDLSVDGAGQGNGKVNGVHGPLIEEEEGARDLSRVSDAKAAFGRILDGLEPNPYLVPELLGWYEPHYRRLLDAYYRGGHEGAQLLFQQLAEEDPALAALRLNDPTIRKRRWSMADLYNTEFPEPNWVIPGLLPTGLAALGARPKIGKSWMALQIATAVGTGGTVFGEQVEQGKVLYLALEDSHRRIKNRSKKQGAPAETGIDFFFDWPTLITTGINELLDDIERYSYSLVVIDTLARAMGDSDPNKQTGQSLHLGLLQRIAIDRNMTILLIDHHRKGNGGEGDVVDDMLGATSKTGVQDVVWGLYRGRGQRTATFKVTGRDIEERELAMTFDKETGLWSCLGNAEDVIEGEQINAVLEAIRDLGTASHAEIVEMTDQDKSNCHKRIKRLEAVGKIKRVNNARPFLFSIADNNNLVI